MNSTASTNRTHSPFQCLISSHARTLHVSRQTRALSLQRATTRHPCPLSGYSRTKRPSASDMQRRCGLRTAGPTHTPRFMFEKLPGQLQHRIYENVLLEIKDVAIDDMSDIRCALPLSLTLAKCGPRVVTRPSAPLGGPRPEEPLPRLGRERQHSCGIEHRLSSRYWRPTQHAEVRNREVFQSHASIAASRD